MPWPGRREDPQCRQGRGASAEGAELLQPTDGQLHASVRNVLQPQSVCCCCVSVAAPRRSRESTTAPGAVQTTGRADSRGCVQPVQQCTGAGEGWRSPLRYPAGESQFSLVFLPPFPPLAPNPPPSETQQAGRALPLRQSRFTKPSQTRSRPGTPQHDHGPPFPLQKHGGVAAVSPHTPQPPCTQTAAPPCTSSLHSPARSWGMQYSAPAPLWGTTGAPTASVQHPTLPWLPPQQPDPGGLRSAGPQPAHTHPPINLLLGNPPTPHQLLQAVPNTSGNFILDLVSLRALCSRFHIKGCFGRPAARVLQQRSPCSPRAAGTISRKERGPGTEGGRRIQFPQLPPRASTSAIPAQATGVSQAGGPEDALLSASFPSAALPHQGRLSGPTLASGMKWLLSVGPGPTEQGLGHRQKKRQPWHS